jgi:hypothetical protein
LTSDHQTRVNAASHFSEFVLQTGGKTSADSSISPLVGSGRVLEYPEPNQEEETQNHQDYAEIEQKDESACSRESGAHSAKQFSEITVYGSARFGAEPRPEPP